MKVFALQLSDAELKRIPLLKLGRWIKGSQRFAITLADIADAVRNFRKRQADLVVDYEHASEHPEVAGGGPVPAAGWVKSMDDQPDADGVLWGGVEYTDRAQELIAASEVKYVSPVLDYAARDKESGKAQGLTITSVALTNRPFLDALPALLLSDGWVAEATGRKEQRAMKVVLTDRAAGKVRVVLDDNTESVLSVEGLEAPPKVIALSDVKRGSDGRFDFGSLPQDGLIAGEVVRAMEAQRELDGAVTAGKILPAQRKHFETIALSDLAGFRELVAGMRPQIDLSERGLAGGGAQAGTIDQVDRQIEALIADKRKANTEMQYHDALRVVLSENPTLEQRRRELMR